MFYFIELWNPTEKWLALSPGERSSYMQNVASATAALVEQGVEILTWSVADETISKAGNFDYFAIWKFPTEALSTAFQNAVSNAGWYEYFEQINVQGRQNTASAVLQELVQLAPLESKV